MISIDKIKPYTKNAKKVSCSSCKKELERLRNRTDAKCKDCASLKQRDLYRANRDAKVIYAKSRRENNGDAINARRREIYKERRDAIISQVKTYYNKNRATILDKSKQYRIKNHDKILVKNRNRKGLIRSLSKNSDVTNKYLVEIIENTDSCIKCFVSFNKNSEKHIDHIKPLAIGGKHEKANLRVLCATCNLTRPRDGRDIKSYDMVFSK